MATGTNDREPDQQGAPSVFMSRGSINLKPPEYLDFHSSNLSHRWKKWREETELYLDLTTEDKSDDMKVKYFKYLIGPHGREVFETMTFDPGQLTLTNVFNSFDAYCNPKKSETVERYKFFTRSQETTESYDQYITDLKILASTCNFGTLTDSLVRDRIVCGVYDKQLRERLLREIGLTLDKCIQLCRATELSKENLKTIDDAQTVHAIHSSRRRKPKHSIQKHESQRDSRNVDIISCRFCGLEHERNRNVCPAFGKVCSRCKGKNHRASMCQSLRKFHEKSKPRKNHKVHAVEESDDGEENYVVINSLTLDSDNVCHSVRQDDMCANQLFTTLKIHDKPISFQIDTGASCNILPQALLPDSAKIDSSNNTLRMYDKSPVKTAGKSLVKVVNPSDNMKYKVNFIIVEDANATPILGCRASQTMNLISVNYDHVLKLNCQPSPSLTLKAVRDEFQDVFSGTGLLEGTYHINLDGSVKPVVHPPRKVPLALKPKLKDELDRLVELGVIAPVSEPTQWVSSLVIVEKPNKLRVCIDPKDLNGAILRSHYPLPTIEDIIPDLGKAKVFSVVDAKNEFWHVALDEESSFLTTFNSPFGRFRWLRMPFGVSSAPEEFQRRQDQVIEGLRGVRGVADDVLIYGEGDTMDEAVADHDSNFRALMMRCRERNLKINPEKVRFKSPEVGFVGHLLTSDGLKPDPAKTKAVLDMPKPTDVAGVQRFCGFVNYLSKFLPNLSDVCEPLRKLTLKDVMWCWEDIHDKAVDSVKRLVSNEPVLKFFDSNEPVTLQCDASMTGLGAALLQNGQPVAFASRALTDPETRYAQIEKELLAVVFGMEKFHQYTYGRPVTVQSDHKPLEVIVLKPLHKAPKRLQRMLLRLQPYEICLKYKPGKEMLLADTLSRAPIAGSSPNEEFESINMLNYVPVSQQRLIEIKEHTVEDPDLQTLYDVIWHGWPDHISSVPEAARPYFHAREELTIQDGLILRGYRAVVPKSLRKDMLSKIHMSHIGTEGCLRRARESIYWPGMNAAVKDFVSKCDICRSNDTQQPKEPMVPHSVPDLPWAKVGSDLFVLDNRNYLITVDYYSNFWEIDFLPDTRSATVINKLKGQFARHGIPDVCVSDNGPQYSSDEFRKFAKLYDFTHITSSPAYPQSNGKAEQAVKTAKSLLKKAKQANSDPYLAILDFRNTPTQGLNCSPAQRLMSRRTRTLLSTSTKLLKPETVNSSHKSLLELKKKSASYYNRGSKPLSPLNIGDSVRISPHTTGDKLWRKAEVIGPVADRPRSYAVITENNQLLRRNRKDLRKTNEVPSPVSEQIDLLPQRSTSPQRREVQPPPVSSPMPSTPRPRPSPQRQHGVTTRSGRTVSKPKYLNDYTE